MSVAGAMSMKAAALIIKRTGRYGAMTYVMMSVGIRINIVVYINPEK